MEKGRAVIISSDGVGNKPILCERTSYLSTIEVSCPPPSHPAGTPFLPADASFLDPERGDANAPDAARAVVIPFGLEASVSYGGGTAHGPAAILAASHQLELFDDELWREAYADYGIAALKPPAIPSTVAAALDQLAALTGSVLDAGKLPFVIGGEHSLTAGAIRPFAQRFPDDLVVLQFDAHWDLRDGYLGEPFSHAAAMRRVLDQPGHENITLVSVGIRAFSEPEARYYEANRHRMHVHLGCDRARWSLADIVAPAQGPSGVYYLRYRCSRCPCHASDGHAGAGRIKLSRGAGYFTRRV